MPDEGQVGPGTTLTQGGPGEGQTPPPVSTVTDWKGSLPPELKAEKSLESFKDVGSLAKSYVEAQKLIGTTLRLPKEDAKPEEWDAFYVKLGRPENADKYELSLPDLPKGKTWADERVAGIKQFAFENGLTPKQAQAMVDYVADEENIRDTASEKQLGADMATLKQEWGGAFQRKLVLAQRAVKQFADSEVFKVLDDSGLGNHPAMIRLFAQIGENLVEDGIISGSVAGFGDKASAKAKIDAINVDPKHPYWNEGPGHKEAVAEMTRLSELAYK